MPRVFVAIWPPDDQADALFGIAQDCARRFGGKPTRRDTIHLTLAFLGEVASERLPTLIEVLGHIKAEPCDLYFDRLACWSHNRLLWAGCSDIPKPLQTLVAGLNRELLGNGFTVARPSEVFTPHLTLVRKLPHRNLPEMTGKLPEISGISWQCRHFVLVESTLSSAGTSYRELAAFRIVS